MEKTLKCLWCKTPIQSPLLYKDNFIRACDKLCAHDLGVLAEIRALFERGISISEPKIKRPRTPLEVISSINEIIRNSTDTNYLFEHKWTERPKDIKTTVFGGYELR